MRSGGLRGYAGVTVESERERRNLRPPLVPAGSRSCVPPADQLGEGLAPNRQSTSSGRNAHLQAQLIEDILDVSRIIAGKLDIERTPVSVPQLLETVVSGMAPAVQAKQIRFEQHIASELPPIEADPKRLHQVLNNVLSNALKFTPEGGSITLRRDADGAWLNIQVQDTGSGIAPEFLPFVFDRFRQADSRATRTHGGLGLAIARHLVEQHGGDIRAHSDGEGKGTTLSIRVPVSSTGTWGNLAETSSSMSEVRLNGLTILIVDDQPDSREMVAALLEERGARIVQRRRQHPRSTCWESSQSICWSPTSRCRTWTDTS
ncbi:hypothetical protein BH18ACI5_BH18ACI5_00750 [soil metagenome]